MKAVNLLFFGVVASFIVVAHCEDLSIVPNVCRPTPVLLNATTGDTASDFFSIAVRVPKCENGPVRKIFTLKGEFYWPPIYRGWCDGLKCSNPPCFARRKVWRTRCVLVYRFINGWWKRIGFRTRRYLEHLECGCKTCKDIRNRTECVTTNPCPNSNVINSFCYWKFPIRIGKRQVQSASSSIAIPIWGSCACCKPFPCPRPRVFSKTTCSCVCPKGTKEVNGKCVGDCAEVSTSVCPFITCADNPKYRCQRKIVNHKLVCACPSCDAAPDKPWCLMTKCLEQKDRPKCVYDGNAKKCRCPRCSDITNRDKCVATQPCPGSSNRKTFCYWTPKDGGCDCCVPRTCPEPKVFDRSSCSCVCPNITCPQGRVFNSSTCQCDCPKGTKDIHGKCVGDCDAVSTDVCQFVTCADNPKYKCRRNIVNHKLVCVCPSCGAAPDKKWCLMTNCLEQKDHPKCVYVGNDRMYDGNARICRCPRCSDITNRDKCVATQPCPGSSNRKTFCYWTPKDGGCDCCVPRTCPEPKVFDRSSCSCVCPNITCPQGRVFNSSTCQCDCPKGTKDIHGKCVGDCDEVSTDVCQFVTCADNPKYKCRRKIENHKLVCVCPSCDAAPDKPWCLMTNCLEQKGNPKCIYDIYAKKCRCPRCSDTKEEKQCLKTFCGPKNHLQCKYDSYWKRCSCPHY